jgi:putative hydrolase of the HAD superfamily
MRPGGRLRLEGATPAAWRSQLRDVRLKSIRRAASPQVWLFDLDDTLHDAGRAVMGELRAAMGAYMERELRLTREDADALRQRYFKRYGATLLGLVRHHGVKPAHFLHDTHRLPGLEQRVSGHRHDFAAIRRLRGTRLILTNAPRAYALRVLRALRIEHLFDGVITIEDMSMFGVLRPKPDARMLRALVARLRVAPSRCVLVEDTLVHQKAARRVGLRTVWLLRYVAARHAQPVRFQGEHRSACARSRVDEAPKPMLAGRPGYVDHRVRGLRILSRALSSG